MVILFDNPLRVLINYELQSPREAFPDCLQEVQVHTEQKDGGPVPGNRDVPS